MSSKLEDTNQMLRQVVTLDYARILYRLRSKHVKLKPKKARKPAFFTQLSSVVHDKSIVPNRSVTATEIEDIRTRTQRLQSSFVRLENMPDIHPDSKITQDILMDIVKQAHYLVTDTRLSKALETYDTIHSELKISLPEATGKIGRYYSASYDLVSAARSRRWSIFKRVEIEHCQIRAAEKVTPLLSDSSSFEETVQRVMGGQNIATHLGMPLLSIEKSYQNVWYAGTKFAKVHAEIQLLLHYELHPELQRPRVICSSKSACYLCNLFVRLHGVYHISRTHGRLYEKWTLPDLAVQLLPHHRATMDAVIDQLNAALERKIRSTLSAQRKVCYHPNESVLVPPAQWSSSELSRVLLPSSAASISTIRVDRLGHENSPEHTMSPLLPSSPKRANSGSGPVMTIRSSPPTVLESERTTAEDFSVTASLPASLDDCETSETTTTPIPAPGEQPATLKSSQSDLVDPIDEPTGHRESLPQDQPPSLNGTLTNSEADWQKLPDTSCSPLELATSKTHLTLFRELPFVGAAQEHVTQGRLKDVWIQVKTLETNDSNVHAAEEASSNCVDIGDIAPGEDVVVKQDGEGLLTELCIRHGQDLVSINYHFAR